MKADSWLKVLVASAAIIAAGVLIALAGPADVEGGADQRVVVKVDDAVETLALDDLADGESREFAAGDHTVTVTRHGDKLEVLLDGDELMGGLPGSHRLDTMVWVGEGDETAIESERKVVVQGAGEGSGELRTYMIRTRKGEGDEEIDVDVEAITGSDGANLDELHAMGHGKTMIFTSAEAGARPIVVAGPGLRDNMVRYRCADSGSELLVPKEQALADSYVCPATGCVMTRVDEPEVHVIKIVRTHEAEDGDDD